MMFEILHDTTGSAAHHMSVDRELVVNGAIGPRLRLYEWDGVCITAGIFHDPGSFLNLDTCQKLKVDIAKRPTGGGVLFHGPDCALSVFIPGRGFEETVEACCSRINERLLQALVPFLSPRDGADIVRSHSRCRFCMSQVTAFDLVWNGKKIGGCAQRKTRAGLLHQASIFLKDPDWEKIFLCVKNPDDVRSMQQVSEPLDRLAGRAICLDEIQEAIVNSFREWRVCYEK